MQRKKGPRLWLDKREGRKPIWNIRDGQAKRSLGLFEFQLAEAERQLAEYLAQKHAPEAYSARADRISIPEVLAFYDQHLSRKVLRDNTPATKRSVETRKIHIWNLLTFWSDKTVADVKTSVCERYEEHRKAMPPRRGMRKGVTTVSSSTVRQELKTLSQAIRTWHGESPLAALPIVWAPPPAPPRQRYLERAEVARLLRAARKLGFKHIARYILIGVYTGTRDEAVRSLSWIRSSHNGWIDTDRGILYRAGFAETQTSKRRPPMILTDRLLSHLRLWQASDTAKQITHVITYRAPPPSHPGAVRRAIRLGRHVRTPQPVGDIHKAWSSTVKEAGLGPDVTPHVLKHTAITWMLWNDLSIWKVAEDTGTSAKTIEEVYGHHRSVESRLSRAAKRRA
jgi:integrase